MIYAINTNSITALRSQQGEHASLVSQLVLGEIVLVKDKTPTYLSVECVQSKQEGWLRRDSVQLLTNDEYQALVAQPVYKVSEVLADVFNMSNKSIVKLPMSSYLPHYNDTTSKFELGGNTYQIHPSYITHIPEGRNAAGVVPTARALINAPRMTGGKTVMGIDDIGLIQLAFSQNGYIVPVSKDELIKNSELVVSLEDAQANDIVVLRSTSFPDELVLGIYEGGNKVILVDEKVKLALIDSLTKTIESTNCYKLNSIIRIS